MTDPAPPQPAPEETVGGDRPAGGEGQELPSGSPSPAAPRRRWGRVAVGALITVALVALAAGAWAVGRDDGEDGDGELADAREVAARFAEAYLTFDAASVNDASATLRSLMTERFAEEFESSRLPTIEELFAGSEVATVARATDVFTTAAAGDRLRAVVFVDVDATGPDADQRLVNLSFVLDVVSSDDDDDGWRVDAVAPIPAPEVVGDPDEPSSSTTTVPASVPTTAPVVPPGGGSTTSTPPTTG